jgi:hypothetical protein
MDGGTRFSSTNAALNVNLGRWCAQAHLQSMLINFFTTILIPLPFTIKAFTVDKKKSFIWSNK